MSEENKFDPPATPSRLTTPRVTLHGSFFASPEPVSEPAGGAGREEVYGDGSGTSSLSTPGLDTIPVGSQVLVFSAYAGVVLRAGPKSCVVHLRRDAPGVERTVPCRYVKPFTAEEEAAALVQTIARGMLDRNRFRMKMSWEVYNTLDNDLEHLHLERSRKLESARALGQVTTCTCSTTSTTSMYLFILQCCVFDHHPAFPITSLSPPQCRPRPGKPTRSMTRCRRWTRPGVIPWVLMPASLRPSRLRSRTPVPTCGGPSPTPKCLS